MAIAVHTQATPDDAQDRRRRTKPPTELTRRQRKSKFVKVFDKTPAGVVCPHFYELVLSNGCPYECAYCYLRLTFRGKKSPVLFENSWDQVRKELETSPAGVYSTGELADSLALEPPLLRSALDYFAGQKDKTLLLVTKSVNTRILREMMPSAQIILSFSVNSVAASQEYETHCPSPLDRLSEAGRMKALGWRIRIRLDPIILQSGIEGYEEICRNIRDLKPEVVTVGMLRQFPGLHNYAKQAPREGLKKAPDGRMRYPLEQRVAVYSQIAEWLGFAPALCKEVNEVWEALGWTPGACNCTI